MENQENYEEIAEKFLQVNGIKLPAKYHAQFIEVCKAYQLNPNKREVYVVGYGDNWNIITGYEVYIKRAERTGKLNGWVCTIEGSGKDMIAKIVIHRKDWEYPFEHYVLFSEAVQKKRDGSVNPMWAKMGSFMLRKVCIAQGFRLCFPDELGGMPYTSDELPEIERHSAPVQNVAAEKTERKENRSPSESFMRLEQILNDHSKDLGEQAYTLASKCLNNINSADTDYMAMIDRCVNYLQRKGVNV